MVITTSPNKRPQAAKKTDWKVYGIYAISALAIGAIIAVGYGMHTKRCEEEKELSIMEKYQSLFITEKEMLRRLEMMKKNTKINTTVSKYDGSRTQTCTAKGGEIMKPEAWQTGKILRHACCSSIATIHRYEVLSLFNHEKHLVKLLTLHDRYQHFYVETCETMPGCTIRCKCSTLNFTQAAIVQELDGSNTRMDIVTFSANCKCLNLGSLG